MRFLAHPLKLCKNGAEIYYKEECTKEHDQIQNLQATL